MKAENIKCTCPNLCDALYHRKKLPIHEFIDKNKVQICHGDCLSYVNEKFPEKKQPIHRAVIKDGYCMIKAEGELPSRVRREEWPRQRMRFEIVN